MHGAKATGESMPMVQGDICYQGAVELAAKLRDREISASEVMSAHLERIEVLNPEVNALCTFLPEQAAVEAREADAAAARGEALGPLHGLPVAVKDLVDTKGIRTTLGSPIYRNRVPTQDALHVERLKAAGAIIVGKTNVPEFGAGSQTFNTVFGATRNPYDLSKTCGGSSGGAAAALACGMVPLADGSDLGGSLRNPASFCNVVGFRPSPGRVPSWPGALPWSPLGVDGPMARTVQDVALFLSVLAGPDPRAPISIQQPGSSFAAPLERGCQGTRVAWTPDLGRYPVQPAVVESCEAALGVFTALGCRVEQATPDFAGADEAFQVLRAWIMAGLLKTDLRNHRSMIKDTVIWNVEKGLALSGQDVAEAEIKRGALYHRVRVFLEDYRFLLLPVSQVAPFDVETEWVTEINSAVMETYIDWMATCYAITLTGLPAISVPCGFTAEGLPVGLQIVGRHQADLEVLQIAYAFQRATRWYETRPSLPTSR